ncbi:MAG: hypothetical protein RR090_11135 [Niameybacter sp.]|uniref:choice-of-anchor I domain-containing protein n=1 Tax=Niameybacter sp. TaxID=2033640 RepID=UPI002FCA0B05
MIGKIGDKMYAFVGLERIGGIMVYDITNPKAVNYQSYINTRDFSGSLLGDCAPEGLEFITKEQSPTGETILLVANEVSGTVSVLEVK